MKEELKKINKSITKNLKKFWDFLQKDSLASTVVFLLLAVIFLVVIFFPTLSLITGSDYPLVIVESCSMYHHEYGFEKTFTSPLYEKNGISIEDTKNWDFQNGLKKGDIIFIVGPKKVKQGEVIIFAGRGIATPIIHRIIDDDEPYGTKGDNYISNSRQLTGVETEIAEDQILGKAVFRIPALGWVKLIFFDWKNPKDRQGFCK